jgi:hypothetical protein
VDSGHYSTTEVIDMSVVPKIIRPMRIIALPLTRAAILPKNHSPTNAGRISDPALTFYHFQLRSPPGTGLSDGENGKKQGRIKSLVTWVSTKAADTWAGFGKAPEGNWKVWILLYFDLRDKGLMESVVKNLPVWRTSG